MGLISLELCDMVDMTDSKWFCSVFSVWISFSNNNFNFLHNQMKILELHSFSSKPQKNFQNCTFRVELHAKRALFF